MFTKWLCVLYHIRGKALKVVFHWSLTVVLLASKVVRYDVSYRGKPLLTRGPDSCFPLVSHSGFGCWVHAVVMCAHKVVRYDGLYRGEPILSRGSDSCFPLVSHSGAVVICAYKVVLYDVLYRGNPY